MDIFSKPLTAPDNVFVHQLDSSEQNEGYNLYFSSNLINFINILIRFITFELNYKLMNYNFNIFFFLTFNYYYLEIQIKPKQNISFPSV
jgi:hypothetical protein